MIRGPQISHKIAALAIALGSVCIGVAFYGGAQVARTSAQYAELTNQQEPALIALAGAARANYEMAYGAAMAVAYPGTSDQGRFWGRSVTQSYEEGLADLALAAQHAPEHRSKIASLLHQLKRNKAGLDAAVELSLFDSQAAATDALTHADPGVLAFGNAARGLVDLGVQNHLILSADHSQTALKTRWILLVVSLIGTAMAVVGALWMANATIVRPLLALRSRMDVLAQGDLDVVILDQGRGDEIGAMSRAVQVFKDRALRLIAIEKENLSLEDAKFRAEAANSAKRQFLAHMAHELRTPLNGVLNMAYLLGQEELGPKQREKLEIIRHCGQDLLDVINSILDFAKLEAGKLELETEVFDPQNILEDVRKSFSGLAERKGLAFRLEVSENALGPRRGDPLRFRQIISNYVSNAIKFTEAGEVTVTITGIDAATGEGLAVAVRDTGQGIPRDKIPLLFQSFSQVDATTTRRFDGTGLGLAICRELAGLMAGRTWVESETGVGSTFHAEVMLPRVEATGCARRDIGEISGIPQPVGALRVLAAEDNSGNQQVLIAIMDSFGIELKLTSNGLEAVEAWRGGSFDLVLMDIEMPEMDGLEATRAIRAAELAHDLPRTPIFAVTANAFVHQIEAYAEAGMDGHLAKPIEIPLLLAVLEQVLNPPRPAEDEMARPVWR